MTTFMRNTSCLPSFFCCLSEVSVPRPSSEDDLHFFLSRLRCLFFFLPSSLCSFAALSIYRIRLQKKGEAAYSKKEGRCIDLNLLRMAKLPIRLERDKKNSTIKRYCAIKKAQYFKKILSKSDHQSKIFWNHIRYICSLVVFSYDWMNDTVLREFYNILWFRSRIAAINADIYNTLLYAVQLFLGYLLMLIVMTYSIWFTLAVILGATCGFYVFDVYAKIPHNLETSCV